MEKLELETVMRRAHVKALTDLSKDWTFQEHSKWREGLSDLPAWRRRAGEKRTYSKVRKPGKEQRKRRKLNLPAKPGSEPVPFHGNAMPFS